MWTHEELEMLVQLPMYENHTLSALEQNVDHHIWFCHKSLFLERAQKSNLFQNPKRFTLCFSFANVAQLVEQRHGKA